MVFLNPKTAADVIASVFAAKNKYIQHGVLEHQHLAQLWKRYPSDLHPKLLSLLEKFDILVQIGPTKAITKNSSTDDLFSHSRSLCPLFLDDKPIEVIPVSLAYLHASDARRGN
jgi:hypothetical protein